MSTTIPPVIPPSSMAQSLKDKLAALKAKNDTGKPVDIIRNDPVIPVIPVTQSPIVVSNTSVPVSAADKLRALLAARKATLDSTKHSISNAEEIVSNTTVEINPVPMLDPNTTGVDKTGKVIDYNTEQQLFITTATKGEDCILIGAAGTGKTTCMRGAVSSLIASNRVTQINTEGHKYLPPKAYGILLVSFTRRAVSNLRKAMNDDLKGNCITIHAALEYEPQYYDVLDTETGNTRTTMRFEPTKTIVNPLPNGIKVCVIDEASMVSVELFEELKAALPRDCQFIFLGDIQQLPPVFGSAILGFKMLELVTVELVQVYRQALESPIIRLAHRILSGKPIPASEYPEWKFPNQLTIHPWKKKLDADSALIMLCKFLAAAMDNNMYLPDEDMILIPFNKACGTIELNKFVANYLARKNKVLTYEIIAGFNKLYMSVGDKVLYDKEDAVITDIKINPAYTGALPQPASIDLDYWGNTRSSNNNTHTITEQDAEDQIDLLLSMTAGNADEDKVRKCSHIITVKLYDTETKITIDNAAAANNLLLSYALTVHKSQGSEYRKVFLLLHQSHSTMLQRELLYTGATRAKEELYVICEPESFTKGIISQRIKGNTLAEKAEFFKGKVVESKL